MSANSKHKYIFNYSCVSSFSTAVRSHAFKFRIKPMECDFQHILDFKLHVNPMCSLNESVDGFGNSICFGFIDECNDLFCIDSNGTVECSEYLIKEDNPSCIYKYATALTDWNSDICKLVTAPDVMSIMHAVHQKLKYSRFVTDNSTSAIQCYNKGEGVCQDFAHLMISACRSVGLLARYVNGITLGEGETHAWVEVWQNGVWYGYDPTYDYKITYGYVKFAHGRDVLDCSTNRGHFYGWTYENMNINCNLLEI